MWLTTEDGDEIPEVTAPDLERILPADAFGAFVILSASEHSFIQAGNDWQPGEECRAFLKQHGSDPWILEYRDGGCGRQFRATERVTLDQVQRAFLSYLWREPDWLTLFDWQEVHV